MKLEKLTDEQKELVKTNKEKYIKIFLTYGDIDKKIAKEVITFVYSIIDKPCPKIIYSKNPMDSQNIANKLNKTKDVHYQFGTYLGIYWASFYAYYNTFIDLGVITEDKFPKYFKLKKVVESNIFNTIEFDDTIIVSPKPRVIHKNEEKQLHSTTEFAVRWDDGYGQYYINGRNIANDLFEKCISGKITKEDFIHEENEENKAAIYEILGQEKMLELLEAEEVDKGTFKHQNGEVEEVTLFKTKNTFEMLDDQPLAWVRFVCPSTGTNYLIDVEPKWNTAKEAAISTSPLFIDEDDYSFTDRT